MEEKIMNTTEVIEAAEEFVPVIEPGKEAKIGAAIGVAAAGVAIAGLLFVAGKTIVKKIKAKKQEATAGDEFVEAETEEVYEDSDEE